MSIINISFDFGRGIYEVASYNPSPSGPLMPLEKKRYSYWLAAEFECWKRIWQQPDWYHTNTRVLA